VPQNSRSTTRERREVPFPSVQLKAAMSDQRRNVPRYVTALEDAIRNRLRHLANAELKDRARGPCSKKRNFPPALGHVQSLNGLYDARNRHKVKVTQNRIDRTVWQRNRSPGRSEESIFKSVGRAAVVLQAKSMPGFVQRIDRLTLGGIVVSKMTPGPRRSQNSP